MCGVFYVDDDTAREIEKTIRKVDEQLRKKRATGIIRPTDIATVISGKNDTLIATPQKWGFPGFENQKVIINARAESVLEKKLFRESVLERRILIPASGFYEWNSHKEKVTFSPLQSKATMYMAGFYNRFQGEDRFVILTTAANDSMKDTHDRMPLILEPQEIEQWLFNDQRLEAFLSKVPLPLQKTQEYEQQKLTFC